MDTDQQVTADKLCSAEKTWGNANKDKFKIASSPSPLYEGALLDKDYYSFANFFKMSSPLVASAKLLPANIPLVSLDGLICDGFTSWAAARARGVAIHQI